jgi:thiol:disulfide interchange protein DsbD
MTLASGYLRLVLTAALMVLLLCGVRPHGADAQLIDAADIVQITTYLERTTAAPGDLVRAAIALEIEHGWHVNSNAPLEEFLIATEVWVDPESPVSVGLIAYPEPEVRMLAISDTEMALYEGRAAIGIEFQLPPDVPEGELTVSGGITYQACDDEKCLPPYDKTFELVLTVGESTAEAQPAPIFEQIDWQRRQPAATGAAGGGVFDPSRGLVWIFIFSFVSGLALNLTPCIYPMIPITISIFGSQGGGPRRAFVLAIFYVLGMAITYSALGTFAALSGSMLGAALQNPFVLIFIAAVMILLSLSMFGLYDIAMPQSLSRVAGETRQGVIGSLFMGLTVGIIAAPCIGPFVLALLTYVGSTGNPVIGFSVFFVLAIGLGIPFMFLATISGSVSALPRSGGWMVWVKKVFGFIMLAMAVYFLTRSPKLIPEQLFLPLVAALALIGGIYLGWVEKSTSLGGGFNRVKKAVGTLLILIAIALPLVPRFITPAEGIAWTPFEHTELASAAERDMPVIVDFSAAWCIPCKELDHYTFATPSVVETAMSFVTLKADLTDPGSPAVKALKEQFGVLGVPTVIFLRPDGTEMEDLRFTGLIKPEEFLGKMQDALGRLEDDGV